MLDRLLVEELLKDSPITRENVINDVRDLARAGEFGLAFDTLCSWIYEDELTIDSAYYDRICNAAAEFGSRDLVLRLAELVVPKGD